MPEPLHKSPYQSLLDDLTSNAGSTMSGVEVLPQPTNGSGYTDEEIARFGDLSSMSPEHVQELIKKKSMEALGLNNGRQKVVPISDIKNWIVQGGECVSTLPNNEAVIRLPAE